jgi:hypothetical protein
VELGAAELANVTAIVTPLGLLPTVAGRPVVAILGFDLFSRFVVELDYDAREMRLHDPASFRYTGSGEIIPVTLADNQPYVRAWLRTGARRLEGDYVVDLGSGQTIMLAADYAAAHDLPGTADRILNVRAAGVGGEFDMAVARVDELRVGSFRLLRPLAFFPPGHIAGPGRTGNIGGGFLRRFRVIVDYARSQLILEATPRLADQEEFDMSGLRLAADASLTAVVRIASVRAGSPGEEAGLRGGEVLHSVDGRPVDASWLPRLRSEFRRHGSTVTLEVHDGTTRRTVRVLLRRAV